MYRGNEQKTQAAIKLPTAAYILVGASGRRAESPKVQSQRSKCHKARALARPGAHQACSLDPKPDRCMLT